jgi:hypothetical protein
MIKRKVDFLVVGAQKAGTTALHSHLSQIYEVDLADVKEVHFFDDEEIDWSCPEYRSYEQHFSASSTLHGELTPIYSYWPSAMERVARYNPAMKIIFLYRDRVQRAWSHWTMEANRGWESQPFSYAIREGRGRLEELRGRRCHRIYSYVERGFYAPQLKSLLRLFGPENVLVIRSDELRSRPASVLEAIGSFLGVPVPGPALQPRAVHVGNYADRPDLSEEDERYLFDLFDDDRIEFDELLTAFPMVSH